MFHSKRPYWPLVAEPGAVNTTCVPDGYVADGTPSAVRSEGEDQTEEARMARLIYLAVMSLDGYIADADGRLP